MKSQSKLTLNQKQLRVRYIVPPNVIYPNSARLAGETGTALVRVFININGLVDEVRVIESSGSKDLDQTAIPPIYP